MAITTYSELKSAVTNWTHRADLSSYADEFIDLTEAKLNRKLRMSEMESSTSVAVTTADLSLPSGFLEMRDIFVSGSPDTILEYVTPYQYEREITTETGKPRKYTIIADAIKLYPVGSYTIGMTYYKQITPLDGTNTSNWILANYPDLYLNGVLYHAYMFVQNAEMAQMYGQLFNDQIDEMTRKNRRKTASGAPLQVVAA